MTSECYTLSNVIRYATWQRPRYRRVLENNALMWISAVQLEFPWASTTRSRKKKEVLALRVPKIDYKRIVGREYKRHNFVFGNVNSYLMSHGELYFKGKY